MLFRSILQRARVENPNPMEDLIALCATKDQQKTFDTTQLHDRVIRLRDPQWWPATQDSLNKGTYPAHVLDNLMFQEGMFFDSDRRTFASVKSYMRDTICSAIVSHGANLEKWPTREIWLHEILQASWALHDDLTRKPLAWQYNVATQDIIDYVNHTISTQTWARDLGLKVFCSFHLPTCARQTSALVALRYPPALLTGPASNSAHFQHAALCVQMATYLVPNHKLYTQPFQTCWPEAYEQMKRSLDAFAILEQRPWDEYLAPFVTIPALQGMMHLIQQDITPYLECPNDYVLASDALNQIEPV